MADRALRGMTIGAKSMESEDGVEFAEDEPEPDEPKKTPRTHWDMLLERRKVDELEVLLNERLEALRSGEVYRERVSG